jgi:hypothetical protein
MIRECSIRIEMLVPRELVDCEGEHGDKEEE